MSVNGTRDKAVLQAPPNGAETLLAINGSTEFFWYGWKPDSTFRNSGRYQKQDLSAWGAGFGGLNPWTLTSPDIGFVETTDSQLLKSELQIGDHLNSVMGGTLDVNKNFEHYSSSPQRDAGSHPNDVNALQKMDPIYDIVNLNRYMASFKNYFPRAKWEKEAPEIGGVDKTEIFAAHELLTEIKSSKLGPYIQWSGEITFHINENQGTVVCPITEWASFKLYLYDSPQSTYGNKAVTTKNMVYVAPKRDVTGRSFSSSEDGDWRNPNVDVRSSHGASEIDLSYNSVTNKWESGTPQLFAKLVTDIPKPDSIPSVANFESNVIVDSLDSTDYEGVKIVPAKGTAMPIRPQNGNPHQWQPNYLKSEEARCKKGGHEKETLTVYNYNSKRSFKRDEEVLLSRIDGVWHVFPLWPGDGDGDAVKTNVGRWGEFSYLMTNGDYFFVDIEGNSFTPREAELSFHADYYGDEDDLNYKTIYGASGGYDLVNNFNTEIAKNVIFEHGFVQQTSFDYLDSQIFGIRGKQGKYTKQKSEDLCSISTTSATVNSAGHAIPPPYPNYYSRNAAHAGVFFGCVFPEGYAVDLKYLDNTTDWNVAGKSAGSTDPTDYFEIIDGNSAKSPFDPELSVNFRNNCRQPSQNDPLLSIDDSKWSRRDSRSSANMFSEYETDNNLSFRHVPADVMLNASPSGENGSPLQPVHRFNNFHNPFSAFFGVDPIVNATLMRNSAKAALLKGVWLGKNGKENIYPNEDSAFDFTPISSNHLMFRPCKMENYVQFGLNAANNFAKASDLTVSYAQDFRVGFSLEANRTQIDDYRPCSYALEDREVSHAPGLWNRNGDGLKWGGEVTNRKRYNYLHEFSYWDRLKGAMRWTKDYPGEWRGANAYGIITTFVTVKANSQINFSTENLYGMGAAAHGIFSIQTGQRQDKTWGVNGISDSYKSENIIDLSVRIYHQHPRNQTLYDPRTFAVHHFNPDVQLEGDTDRESKKQKLDGFDGSNAAIKYEYKYFTKKSDSDFVEICRYAKYMDTDKYSGEDIHSSEVVYSAESVDVGSFILADATVDGNTIKPPVCPQKFWLINPIRVGMLLPFKYNRKDVGTPIPVGEKFSISATGDYVRLASSLNDTPVLDILSKMIVKKPGTGYSEGDIVGHATKGITFKVEKVTDGVIDELECLTRGKSLSVTDTALSDAKFNSSAEGGPLSLKTLQSAGGGKDFEAYFVAITPYNNVHIDPKPYLMKRGTDEITRIASNVTAPQHANTGRSSDVEAEAFVNEIYETSFVFDPSLYSENKEYDVFFHFHNDITMTWLASSQKFHGHFSNPTECAEQHITVQINPI